MGFLFSKLWSYFGTEEHKIIIVGLDNAGKTTILYQFLMNEVVHTSPTIGSNVEEVIWKNIHFLMWDIGGQETLRSTWSTYYTHAQVDNKQGFFLKRSRDRLINPWSFLYGSNLDLWSGELEVIYWTYQLKLFFFFSL